MDAAANPATDCHGKASAKDGYHCEASGVAESDVKSTSAGGTSFESLTSEEDGQKQKQNSFLEQP